LLTFYISGTSSLAKLFSLFRDPRNIDLNPPLQYLATRASFSLFGFGHIATRLPSVVALLFASLFCFWFVKKRLGAWYGALATLGFWYPFALQYSTEARPYALLLMFFAGAMFCWDEAAQERSRRRIALFVLPLAIAGMLLSHGLAPFYLIPFFFGELLRLLDRRRPDFAMWASFCAGLAALLAYTPLLQRLQTHFYPFVFQASPGKLWSFYFDEITWTGPFLLVAIVAALVVGRIWMNYPRDSAPPAESVSAYGFALGVLSIAPCMMFVLMRREVAFWPRYALGTSLLIGFALAWFIYRVTAGSRFAAVSAFAAMALFSFYAGSYGPERTSFSSATLLRSTGMEDVDPQLPFVTSSGLAFLELDHYGDPTFVSRLYYLTDPVASFKYAHADMFEGMAFLKANFPIRAHVEPADIFLPQHAQFLVLGSPDYPEEWLIAKLIVEGAHLEFLHQYPTRWLKPILFRVTVPQPESTVRH
jgi:hypothetical protein